MSNEREFILYRWWRADGTLLYVGKSVSLFARISSHRKSSAFFSAAATMTIERFPDAVALAEGEVLAIQNEHPIYNVMHNGAAGVPKMLTPLPQPGQTVASHWVTIDAESIRVGDVIRYTFDDEIYVQGIVDDDLYDCDEHDDADICNGWIIWTDSGSVEQWHEGDFGLGELDKWLTLDASDETKDRIFSAWLHGRARQIGQVAA